MALFKKVDKVLAALGNVKALERLHADTSTDEKIENIGGSKLAESDEGMVYGGIDDLNGYLFLETVFLSRISLKTLKGATLSFIGKSDFKLTSDTQEIESDFSKVSNRFMTKISFDISENEIHQIKDKKYEKVILEVKKKSLTMLITEE